MMTIMVLMTMTMMMSVSMTVTMMPSITLFLFRQTCSVISITCGIHIIYFKQDFLATRVLRRRTLSAFIGGTDEEQGQHMLL